MRISIMFNQKIEIQSESHWHDLRAGVIGSSDIACLFGVSMYKTAFTLWHEKAGTFKQIFDNSRMKFGRALESAIGNLFEDETGKKVVKSNHFYQLGKLGATPDFITENGEIVEVKNIDEASFYKNWTNGEPPVQYMLQLQHQMLCCNAESGYVVALVGGNRLEIYPFKARQDVFDAMISKANDFFASIQRNEAPKIESGNDLAVIKSLYYDYGNVVDLSDDDSISEKILRVEEIKAQIKSLQAEEDLLKAELLNESLGASIICKGYKLDVRKNKDIAPKIITEDMLGQEIGGRKGASVITVKKLKSAQ